MSTDPINDLVPLCSNCHRMIHRDKYNVLTVEHLKKKLLA
ncbi:HNH endonuclease (plasmid) [Leuconostoc carnosum]|nr:HNH endonuclease [Leuconostoc carnosum]